MALSPVIVVAAQTEENLFGDLGELLITSEAGQVRLVRLSLALERLRKIPNEIGYFVFISSYELAKVWLEAPAVRRRLRDLFLDGAFYAAMAGTIEEFLDLCPKQIACIWPGTSTIDPIALFKRLGRVSRRR